MRVLYSNSVSCVHASQSESAWFTIVPGVRQGCVLATDSFAMGMKWLLERTVWHRHERRDEEFIVTGED